MKKSIIALLLAAMLLCSCANAEGQNRPENDSNGTQSVQGNSTQNTEEEEVDYMESVKDLIVELPPEDIYKARDGVEYPKFEKHTYYSSTAERDTNVNVLLPIGYDEEKEYPVLYILHGYWDNEEWMARDIVHIPEMLTNLVADGEAEEMIVVCPYIFCSKELAWCTGMDDKNTLAYDNFINDFMTDLKPFIEENFSVSTDREKTAITGFSMGGRESLFIGVRHPELFGYIAACCPAPGLVESTGWPFNLKDDELKFEDEKPKLLMISYSESDGVVGSNPTTYGRILNDHDEEHLIHKMTSTGHDHTSVSPHMYNLFRMIFR